MVRRSRTRKGDQKRPAKSACIQPFSRRRTKPFSRDFGRLKPDLVKTVNGSSVQPPPPLPLSFLPSFLACPPRSKPGRRETPPPSTPASTSLIFLALPLTRNRAPTSKAELPIPKITSARPTTRPSLTCGPSTHPSSH